MEHVEADALGLGREIELDRDGDQAELDGPLPHRSCHGVDLAASRAPGTRPCASDGHDSARGQASPLTASAEPAALRRYWRTTNPSSETVGRPEVPDTRTSIVCVPDRTPVADVDDAPVDVCTTCASRWSPCIRRRCRSVARPRNDAGGGNDRDGPTGEPVPDGRAGLRRGGDAAVRGVCARGAGPGPAVGNERSTGHSPARASARRRRWPTGSSRRRCPAPARGTGRWSRRRVPRTSSIGPSRDVAIVQPQAPPLTLRSISYRTIASDGSVAADQLARSVTEFVPVDDRPRLDRGQDRHDRHFRGRHVGCDLDRHRGRLVRPQFVPMTCIW